MAKTNKDFVTKTYLDKRLYKFKKEIVLAVGDKGDELKSELYNIKDEVVGEIKAMREEFDVHQSSHARINDELQEHSRQITKLQAQ